MSEFLEEEENSNVSNSCGRFSHVIIKNPFFVFSFLFLFDFRTFSKNILKNEDFKQRFKQRKEENEFL